AELLADRAQDLSIEPVQALVVDLEEIEGRSGHVRGDGPVAAYLGEVAHPLEQAVGHAGGTAAACGDGQCAAFVDLDLEQPGRPPDDPGQLGRGVMLEPMLDPEAVGPSARDRKST